MKSILNLTMVSETVITQNVNGDNRYAIAICEFHNKYLHGMDGESSMDIQSHILATYVLEPEEYYNNDWKDILRMMRRSYSGVAHHNHDNIRNYKNIVTDPKYFTVDVVELKELEGNELVASKKTHLIKMMQRRWRKVYNERQRILNGRRTLASLRERERTGCWPKGLRHWPTMKNINN